MNLLMMMMVFSWSVYLLL